MSAGERSTGGSRPTSRPRRMQEDEWEALLAEKKVPSDGRKVPHNVLCRPIVLPPMERVQK